MNISKLEQRVLHCLAQGGRIQHIWHNDRIVEVDCYNRDGYRLADCTLDLFKKLKRRGLKPKSAGPYAWAINDVSDFPIQICGAKGVLPGDAYKPYA